MGGNNGEYWSQSEYFLMILSIKGEGLHKSSLWQRGSIELQNHWDGVGGIGTPET